MRAADRPVDASPRWRLNRAGIVNVYQYDDEVIHFAGGRLLLRGVNGSGKTTAMNMLLPFLLTASQRRIDAAGEQSGILKAWMLSGRDDAQPVGYLWIEFERLGEFLVCGCGIKANRQSDRVTTWWFITSKRPGAGLRLVSGGVPLSADGLRAELGGDAVFNERSRRDYRREIERSLFGGAGIGQHIELINRVRSPRVGDRIDVDIPNHLADSLPQLSEQALEQAAQPLDELEEHRRNVDELARTLAAVRGLLGVYGSYCAHDLRQRAESGRSLLAAVRRRVRDEREKREAAETAAAEVRRLDAAIRGFQADTERLRGEIAALEESRAYRDGQDLEALRDLVAELAEQRDQAARRVGGCELRVDAAAGRLASEQRRSRRDLQVLNADLADVAESAVRNRLACAPPGPATLEESDLELEGPGGRGPACSDSADAPPAPEPTMPADTGGRGPVELKAPAGMLDAAPVGREIAAAGAAVLRRGADIDEVEQERQAHDTAEGSLRQARSVLALAESAARSASERLDSRERGLRAARGEWEAQIHGWASEAYPALRGAGTDAPMTTALAAANSGVADAAPAEGETAGNGGGRGIGRVSSPAPGQSEDVPDIGDHETVRSLLLEEAERHVGLRRDAATAARLRLEAEQADADAAQALVDELAARSEPDPPRLDWQQASDYCFADLIDFSPCLDSAERAGLEAALQASGLLSARVAADGSAELADGELVAVATGGAPDPLGDRLTATVPERLAGEVDAELLGRLLDSISCDTSAVDAAAAAAAAVSTDGSFSVGSLRGRHSKENAEFIGVTARREALERERRQAAEGLRQALEVAARSRADLAVLEAALEEAEHLRSVLPSTEKIVASRAEVAAAADAVADAAAERREAARGEAAAEQASRDAWDRLQRAATTLGLPPERPALRDVRRDLHDLQRLLDRCRSRLDALSRSVGSWLDAAERWRQAVGDLSEAREARNGVDAKWQREHARLITIEDSIGAAYAEILAARDHCKTELAEADSSLSTARSARDRAVDLRAVSGARARSAADRRSAAERECEAARRSLAAALETPGYLEAAASRDSAASEVEPVASRADGPEGLSGMLEVIERLLEAASADTPPAPAEAPPPDAAPAAATADSVRQSLRQRRDTLGAGWDAETLQPDPLMPLMVEVSGPWGRAPLADSVRRVEDQHRQLVGLLRPKQDDALRELLQGLIAREVAEKIHGARHLVELMNRRLGDVKTAHEVGVSLRWRRSPELEPATGRMVQLMSRQPDLRTEDQESELRRTLSEQVYQARAMQPDVPYRQLIAETLDYKKWHEMSVMVHRANSSPRKLTRRLPLSEGEKKLVTYLPLFAAVAASCDALSEQGAAPGGGRPGIARFVLLDDAFAKVSEDNHPALFRLLVELDLDLIATSERLWGTHPDVPQLSIVEVVRDAKLGAILLEHYRWDGAELSRGTPQPTL